MKKSFSVLLFTSLLLVGASTVFAAVNDTPNDVGAGSGIRLLNPLGNDANGDPISLPKLLVRILDFVVNVGAIVVALMMVYVGYLFVTARGNQNKISEARSALFSTIVGALIVLGSKAIASGILATVEALSQGS